MIQDVKSFLEKVFQLELDAHNADSVPDLEGFNNKVKELYSYCVPEMKNKLGLMEKSVLESDDYYERYKDIKLQYLRFIFKISEYENETYGKVYLAYVTGAALTRVKFLKYSDCFFIVRLNNEYKIASGYFVYSEYLDNIRWMKHGGYEDLTFENAGKLVAIEHYIEPVFSERRPEESNFTLAEHRAEK